MRKIKLMCILFACIFIISGCAANDLPIIRHTNSKNDVIKFFGVDWLTERSEIEKKFNEDFGTNYKCEEENIRQINEKLDEVSISYSGKDYTKLNWQIAGHTVNYLSIHYIKDKSDKYYIYGGYLSFDNCTDEDMKDIISKLDGLYTRNNEKVSESTEVEYIDTNKNEIWVSRDSRTTLSLSYFCVDIDKQVMTLSYEYKVSQKENNYGL